MNRNNLYSTWSSKESEASNQLSMFSLQDFPPIAGSGSSGLPSNTGISRDNVFGRGRQCLPFVEKPPGLRKLDFEQPQEFRPNPTPGYHGLTTANGSFRAAACLPAPERPPGIFRQPSRLENRSYESRLSSFDGDYDISPNPGELAHGPGFSSYGDNSNSVVTGHGKLTWLSAKAGLITGDYNETVSFQLKDFCDQNVTDFTSILCVGFRLKFTATHNEENNYTATVVGPFVGGEVETVLGEGFSISRDLVGSTYGKDQYSREMELDAVMIVLGTFQRLGRSTIQICNLPSQIGMYGDDRMFRYVGSSSMKRRQFVERRTHLFILKNDDTITLQSPLVFGVVILLAEQLMKRGGITSIASLFDFVTKHKYPGVVLCVTGSRREDFIGFLNFHSWIFSVLPSNTFVSVRRSPVWLDYPSFVKSNFPTLSKMYLSLKTIFPEMDYPAPHTQPLGEFDHHSRGRQPSLGRDSSVYGDSQYSQYGNGNGGQRKDSSQWSDNESISDLFSNLYISRANLGRHTASVGVQAEDVKLGSGSCTCQCRCGGANKLPALPSDSDSVTSTPTLWDNYGIHRSEGDRESAASSSSAKLSGYNNGSFFFNGNSSLFSRLDNVSSIWNPNGDEAFQRDGQGSSSNFQGPKNPLFDNGLDWSHDSVFKF